MCNLCETGNHDDDRKGIHLMLGDHDDDDGDDVGDGDHLQHHPGQSSQTQVQSVRSFPW